VAGREGRKLTKAPGTRKTDPGLGLMAYRLEPTQPPGREVVRLALELLADGSQAVVGRQPLEDRVHVGRTTCKKLRALFRLMRRSDPRFWADSNDRLRGAGRSLTEFRDAEVLLATARSFKPGHGVRRASLDDLGRRLRAHRQALLGDRSRVREVLVRFGRELQSTRAAVRKWRPKDKDLTRMSGEIETSYRRARRAGRSIEPGAAGAAYHEWRKAVKTFGYHCRLLRAAWPEVTKPYAREVGRLADLLGREHDLTVLADFVRRENEEGSRRPAATEQKLIALIERRQTELRREARAMAVRIFAGKPRDYARRIGVWWNAAAHTPGGADRMARD
jgi:CHAD domain-containing protein